jgi:hypothetical protein
LLAQVDRQRAPASRVTLNHALDAWFDVHEGEATTLDTYRGYATRVIRPALGETAIAKISPRMLEQLYSQLVVAGRGATASRSSSTESRVNTPVAR